MNISQILLFATTLFNVDPFIGTSNTGHTFPGATYPFGKVQLSPDTMVNSDWRHCSGYQSNENLHRVSHLHLSGTGMGDGYDIGWKFNPFKPSYEYAIPGYYKASLKNIEIELTVSRHCGWTKYKNLNVTLDLTTNYFDTHIESYINYNDGIISGKRRSRGWVTNDVYFAVKSYSDMKVVCLSHHNEANAIKYVQKAGTFKHALLSTIYAWYTHLRILKGPKIIQTALYHSLIHPSLYSDPEYFMEEQYTVFSTWDTYRSWNTLMTLGYPQYIPMWVQSFKRHRFMPIWELWGQDSQVMTGTHSISMAGEYVLKGLVDVDVIWPNMIDTLNRPDRYYQSYYNKDFISYEECRVAPSMMIEHSYTDNVLNRIIEKYNKTSPHNHNMKQYSYHTIFHEDKFLPRHNNGNFKTQNYDRVNNGFEEGSSLGYQFAITHDFKDFFTLHGDNAENCSSDYPCTQKLDGNFKRRLDEWFNRGGICGQMQDLTNCIGQYVHSNEPAHHIIYYYTILGYPEKTCELVQRVVREFYSVNRDGIPGNDDAGQTSSWIIFAALGFYPVNPSSNVYILGCPALEDEIKLNNLKVTREGNGNHPTYYWNGELMNRTYLTHDEILNGGHFHVILN